MYLFLSSQATSFISTALPLNSAEMTTCGSLHAACTGNIHVFLILPEGRNQFHCHSDRQEHSQSQAWNLLPSISEQKVDLGGSFKHLRTKLLELGLRAATNSIMSTKSAETHPKFQGCLSCMHGGMQTTSKPHSRDPGGTQDTFLQAEYKLYQRLT